MKARHKAGGGAVYEGAGSKVIKEAHETQQHKNGGRVKHMGKAVGEKPMPRADKRARGGRVSGSDKDPFAPGAARHPFSSAHKG